MEGLPTCANCLSIARNAKTMGIDVDGPQNDKGLYGLIPIHKVSSISNDYIIHWRAFSDKFARKRFGFMSQVSPGGKFVVTSIDVPGGLEKIDAPATEFYRLFDISAQLADKKQFDAAREFPPDAAAPATSRSRDDHGTAGGAPALLFQLINLLSTLVFAY
jgi:hypothetical protein